MDGLLDTLIEHFPLPPGIGITSIDDVPPPRVLLRPVVEADINILQDPLQVDLQYHKGTIKANQRITASDWYQDVRHLEFGFEDDIKLARVTLLIVPPILTNTLDITQAMLL